MTGLVKVGLVAAGVGAIIWAYNAAQKAIADFAYKIVGYGVPSIDENYRVTLPVQIEFNNPTPLTIDVDNVLIDVYLMKQDVFEHVGRVQTPITLEPGISRKDVVPIINLQSVFGGLFRTISTALKSKALTLRTDVTVTYKGFTLPVQSSTDNIQLW